MLAHLRRLLARRDGSVAIVFAITVVVLSLLLGVAVDVGEVNLATSRLQEAADSAVLQAIADNKNEPAGAARSSATQAEALQKFAALAAQGDYTIVSDGAVSSSSSPTLSVTLNYSAKVAITFGSLFNMTSYPVASLAAATAAAPSYVDVYLLVDLSTSMGVGATAADQLLMNETNGMAGPTPTSPGSSGCMFACHFDGTDTLAHNVGATLRLDVVKSALQQVVAAAQDVGSQTIVQFALVSFGDNVTVNVPLTSNLTSIASGVSNLQLAGADAGTSTEYALNYVQNLIPVVGDGSSASSPLVFVILATDGTGNSADNTGTALNASWAYSSNFYPAYSEVSAGAPFPHAVPDPIGNAVMDLEGLDPAWCQGLKSKGVNVMTLEMPYILPTSATVNSETEWELNDLRIQYIQNTLLPIIPGQMTACASQPSYHVSATAPSDIISALTTLFGLTTSGTPRLTQ